MPIFSSKRNVLLRIEVIKLLCNVEDTVNPSIICHQQPVGVNRHCSFLVDLDSQKSHDDIKCDYVGSWGNLSSNRSCFVNSDEELKIVSRKCGKFPRSTNVSNLKRTYYMLEDGIGDFRRRIDTML